MLRVTYEEVVCPVCEGTGCVDGDPCPDSPGLCDCLPCPECHGAGHLRYATLVEVDEYLLAA